MDEVVVVMESDKGEAGVRTTEAGTIKEFLVSEGDDIDIGAEVFVVDTEGKGDASGAPAQEEPKAAAAPVPAQDTPKAHSTPSPTPAKPKAPTPAQEAKKEATQSSGTGVFVREETREKMSRMRRTAARRLRDSQNTYASITTFQEIDMGAIMDMRKEIGPEFEKIHGIKLGFMSFFIKAAALALKERPIVNSVIDTEAEEIIYRNYIDISVAVSAPKGLVVPVLRDVQNMSFADVELGLRDLAAKARDGKLAIEDMTGGTFTLSNG